MFKKHTNLRIAASGLETGCKFVQKVEMQNLPEKKTINLRLHVIYKNSAFQQKSTAPIWYYFHIVE
ncbi:hypothetical protein BV917_00520 [Leptospira santarosai serovar Guaricura]|nr:hypothetical protein BV917_00520 [Leptospira santarosai serovar Guaricura]